MTDPIVEGEPTRYGRDFFLGHRDPFRDWLDKLLQWPNPHLVDQRSGITLHDAHGNVHELRILDVQPARERVPGVTEWVITVDAQEARRAGLAPDVRPEAPEQRALPRPAKAPPMWADQPNKQRRTKYRPTRRVK
ncbi:hypothetical protein GS461_09765 [Rhodococcus hoagii]|nr:hypothetical protein [Prescottella equi]